jgi:mRNA-degrading endonuclease RelE of RelBE toxin-antitoxin system
MYGVRFTANAVKQLKKLGQATSALIIGWIRKNEKDVMTPEFRGKGNLLIDGVNGVIASVIIGLLWRSWTGRS